jgi:hypothetical protein
MIEHQIEVASIEVIKEKLDISGLPAGVYFLSVTCSPRQHLTGKFIKK